MKRGLSALFLLGLNLYVTQVLGSRTSQKDIEALAQGDTCPKGTWAMDGIHDIDMGDFCEMCYAGEYNNQEGQYLCEICTAGTYTPDDGYWECISCPKGQITTQPGSSKCFDCPAGQYTPEEGGTTCKNCQSGHYQDQTGSAGCNVCPAGTFQEKQSARSCDSCPAGTSSPAQTSTSGGCTACLAGSHAPAVGSLCLPCPFKTYSDVAGSAQCKECPTNLDQEGATTCQTDLDCPAGQVPVEGVCTKCEAGTFAPHDADVCTPCPKGSFNGAAGAEACTLCPVKTYGPNTGAKYCPQCDANDQEGGTTCSRVCPLGQILHDGVCMECWAGSYQNEGACSPCGAGSYQDLTGQTVCKKCSAGHFAGSEGSVLCEACPAGQYQDKQGSVSCESCPPGYYGDSTGEVECSKCAAGTYNPTKGQTSCSVCPAGTVSENPGQLACQECDAGSYSATTSSCTLCSAGSFSDDGAAVCTLCSPGTYAPDQGYSGCPPVPEGYYADKEGCSSPILCPTGSYCPEGAVLPNFCPAGSYGPGEGAASVADCKDCDAGKYCDVAGLSAPTGECDEGYYCPGGSTSPTQEVCPAGTYCPTGTGTPVPCPAGTYGPDAGSTSAAACSPCPPGQYCSDSGASAPTGACEAGYYCTEGSATPTQNISPKGHYAPEGSAVPLPCPSNTYGALTGLTSADECTKCPGGEKSDPGSTSVEDCKETICAAGWYRVHTGDCKICPAGTFSNIENAVACRRCPRHQYNSEAGSSHCMKCPDSSYTWGEGTASFEGCVGPVIQVCSGEALSGSCHRYYDDNLNLNTTILSLEVIRGEFDLFEKTNLRAGTVKVSETDGVVNVRELGSLGTVMSFAPILNNVFCSLGQGRDFRGSVRSTSKSGKPCINWTKTPLADKARPNNLCQNPADEAKPFCYITETEKEACDIPACVWDMACYSGIGQQYRGPRAKTLGGKTCQNWQSDWPHPHSYHEKGYSWAGVGDHNKCRNPDQEGKPWCYTTNLFVRWDYCPIARCSRDRFNFYKF